MRNIIKSDFYYQWNNKKIYIYAVVFMLVYISGTSIGNIEWASNQTLYSVIKIMINQQYMMIMIVLLGITCYYQGKLFENRFLMYQIISHGRKKPVFSKYIVQTFFNIVFLTGLMLCSLTILCNVYQIRIQVDINVLGFYLLFILLIMRYTVRLITMVYFFKNGIIAGIATWLIVVAEWVPLLIGQEYTIIKLVNISRLFLPGQINSLTMGQSFAEVLPYIIITTFIELGVEMICICNKKEML